MQSKPGSNNVIYLNYDGETIIDNSVIGNNNLGNYFGWAWHANQNDIDGTPITKENKISNIKVPPADPGLDRLSIFKQLVNKFDIFDVNITDERSVYNNASGFKTIVLITSRPSPQEYNDLTIANNKSENGPWPYSYRRLLRYTELDTETNILTYPMFSASGLAGPVSGFSRIVGGLTQYVFVWTKLFLVKEDPNDNKNLYLVRNSVSLSSKLIARTIAHEVGHKFGLIHDGQLPRIEYYAGHNDWVPIMGADRELPRPLAQWSKGEYKYAAHVQPGLLNPSAFFLGDLQDDLIIIGNTLGFIKTPKDSISKTQVRTKDYEMYEKIKNQDGCWKNMGDLGVYTRVISQSDVITFNNKKVIEGMIGFPGDFEIIKMLLPHGKYDFTIDPVWHNPESMLDVNMSILNCHCQRPKEKYPVNCNKNDLPTRYPVDTPLENFQCISFDDCLNTSQYDSYIAQTPKNNKVTGITITLTLPYTQIIYLMVAGDKQAPFEDGWSVYSSVGKYYLEIVKDGNNNPESFLQTSDTAPLPVCNCEEISVCKDGKIETVLLFTQEEGEQQGTQNLIGPHIQEYSIVLNGESKTKKFLVYGPPMKIDEDCPKGKFCLDVVDNETQQCVKQEFVVASDFEKKKV
jgi:hypothetical protein